MKYDNDGPKSLISYITWLYLRVTLYNVSFLQGNVSDIKVHYNWQIGY